ncbi:MAG: protein-L-isoaspartate(D-aspartate) O-methyltransferase [Woeseiaceae bacterium]|nr:protein-L-isoaspartate(D-aspartate) O-methyltransferase [Woeseiaceae bacterium]
MPPCIRTCLPVILLACAAALPAASERAGERAAMVDVIESYAGRARASGEAFAPNVLDALGDVPRHEFVPPGQRELAYANRPLPIGHGQTISQPYIVALMTDLVEPDADDVVLEVGTGSGYQAAILAGLVDRVYTIEIVPELARQAGARLERLGYDNVETRLGDGYYGWDEHGPFDAIVVTAAPSHVPPPLIEQLARGGRMVIPVGGRFMTQQLLLIEKTADDEVITRQVASVRFVPLTGERSGTRAGYRAPPAARHAAGLGVGHRLRDPADARAVDRAVASLRLHDHQPGAARLRRERHVHRARPALAGAALEPAFSVCALLTSVTIVGSYIVGQRVPFNALEIVWDPGQFVNLTFVYLIFFVPFFFAACCIGLAFTCRGRAISRIYFVDLFGAGLGALLIIALLFPLPPQDALRVLAALALAAAMLTGWRVTRRLPLAVAQLAWLALLAFGPPADWLALKMSDYKGLPQALTVVDSRALAVRSSPLGLLTVVESPTVPIRHAPGLSFRTKHVPPEQLAVFTDGGSMSAITRYDGNPASVGYLGDMTAAAPFTLHESPDVLVLGAGGGSDVLLSLYHGAARVDAVELNPQMTELVASDFADFAGHLYADPRVNMHTAEARGYVASTERRYDIIHIGLLDAFGASGTGVNALNETYLYTVEALREYIAHLEPGGLLAITRWLKLPPRDNLKLAATAIEALRGEGVAQPGDALAMLRSWNTSTLIVRNGAFPDAETEALREFARTRSFDMAWYPSMPADAANRFNQLERPWLYEGIRALLGPQSGDYLERYKFHVAPATDDRPYFFHFFKWSALPEVMSLRAQGGAGLIEWGYLVLVATLAQATVAGLALIVLPLLGIRRDWPPGAGLRFGGYFLLLGLAFLFVEIAFIQKFILFLSHPLYSVAVVLAGFLVFAGLGSAASVRVCDWLAVRLRSPLFAVVAGIALLALVYITLLPPLFDRFIGLPDLARVAISLVLIAPLAFLMGIPFPAGLSRVAGEAPAFVPWAWGVNGFASVISAALATLLAIEFGFVAVIVAALLLYAAAAAILR